MQFSGNKIVSGSDDTTLKIWSAINGRVRFYGGICLMSTLSRTISPFLPQCLKTLQGHTGGVWCSEFDGQIVVSGSTDRTLRVCPISL